ncbi:hypothetical protein AGMMS50268_37990 [Spirochaetia bacterium]|nr:hypothetical protein AGMMS50268_37990 [Spirochaetia bacterium]
MAVYSEVLTNEEILSSIPKTCKNILIVACGGCMNESLAYKNNVPIFKQDENNSMIPFASKVEADRISTFLLHNGFDVRIKMIADGMPVLCIYSAKNEIAFFERSFRPDVILALSCKAGMFGLENNFDIPILPLTKQLGFIAYAFDDIGGERIIVNEQSKVIMFNNR